MRKIDLQVLMDGLYETGDYYATIQPVGEVNYEEEYHEITFDPDGKKRNLLEEREQWLTSVKEITDYLDNLDPCRILDIGCGLGWLLSSLSDDWDKNGIEISKFASNHARQFGEIHNGTLDDFPDIECFDIVVMNHVIEHLSDPISALKKINNMLNDDGGFLIISTPDFDSAAARRYGDRFRLLNDPTHISLFSADSMHRCLRDHGFKIIKVEYPYFETPWFSKKNLLRILDDQGVSPPFYGSAMTFFCENAE